MQVQSNLNNQNVLNFDKMKESEFTIILKTSPQKITLSECTYTFIWSQTLFWLKKKINIVGYFWQTNIQNIGKSISKIYTNRPDCLTCNKSNLFSLWNVLNYGILKWNMVREIRHSLPDWSWPANMPPIITKSAPAPRRNTQIQIKHVTPPPLGKPKEPHPTPSKKDCRC